MSTESLGRSMVEVLRGSWRPEPPRPAVGRNAFEATRELLVAAGCSALCRAMLPELEGSRPGFELRVAMANQSRSNLETEEHLHYAVLALREVDIEPLFSKGWVAARDYAANELRPYGDIDLCVPADRIDEAQAALSHIPRPGLVDLHGAFPQIAERPYEELLGRARTVRKANLDLHVLGREDLFRHTTLHLMRNGAWRPLWLCDVAAQLEAGPLDWKLVLAGSRVLGDWVQCTAHVVQQLLQTHTEVPPPASLSAGRVDRIHRRMLAALGRGRRLRPDPRRSPWSWGELKKARERWPNVLEIRFLLEAPIGAGADVWYNLRYAARKIRQSS